MLRRGGHAAAPVLLDRGAHERGHLAALPRKDAAADGRPAGHPDVGHGCEVHVDADPPEIASTLPGGFDRLAHGPLGGLSLDRIRKGEDPDVAALLVGCDEGATASGALQPAGERADLSPGAGVRLEQDNPRRPVLAQDVEHVVGRPGSPEAQDDQLADLLLQAKAVDRALGRGETLSSVGLPGLGRRAHDRPRDRRQQGDGPEDAEADPSPAGTGLPGEAAGAPWRRGRASSGRWSGGDRHGGQRRLGDRWRRPGARLCPPVLGRLGRRGTRRGAVSAAAASAPSPSRCRGRRRRDGRLRS